MTRNERWRIGKGALAAVTALLLLPALGGCAKSAFNGWAQTSSTIAPSQRPSALTAFSSFEDRKEQEVQ